MITLEEVEKGTIFLTGVGSRAYGIHNEDSDYDQAGVVIPPKRFFYGLETFKQFQDFPTDKTIYSFEKAIRLISDNNPNMLDLLFAPERCILVLKPEWKKILENRHLFISKKCRHTYSGYAFAQLRRIETHRKYLFNPIKEKPTRESFGLPPTSIFPTAQLRSVIYSTINDFLIEESKNDLLNNLDEIYSNYIMPSIGKYIKKEYYTLAMEFLQLSIKSQADALRTLGDKYIKDEYIDIATKELRFYNASLEWSQYQGWLKNRNVKRAELEEKWGYDTKHAAHLVRLIRMCLEILETGVINVDRTLIDAEELKSIRKGEWTFEKLKEYAEQMDKKAEELYKKSKLQHSPDYDKINLLQTEICETYLSKNKGD